MTLRTGDEAPRQIAIDVTPETAGDVNLSLVLSAEIRVRRPDLTTDTWTATLSNQTTTTLRVTHEVEVDDLTVEGTYTFYVLLTFAEGPLKSDPVTVLVKDPFDD